MPGNVSLFYAAVFFEIKKLYSKALRAIAPYSRLFDFETRHSPHFSPLQSTFFGSTPPEVQASDFLQCEFAQ